MLVFNGNIWMAVVFGCVMFGVTFCWKFLDNLVLICFWPQNLAHLVGEQVLIFGVVFCSKSHCKQVHTLGIIR